MPTTVTSWLAPQRLHIEAGEQRGGAHRAEAQDAARLFGHHRRALQRGGDVLRVQDRHAVEVR